MSQQTLTLEKKAITGWSGIWIIALAYAGLYALNYWLPLNGGNYTTRIWNWSQAALALTALAILTLKSGSVKSGIVALGFVLGALSAVSHFRHDSSLAASLFEGLSV